MNPATSSSVVVAVTVWSATESKSLSEIASMTEAERVDEIVPSTKLSSTPVTVTVCGVFQLAFVKVNGVFTVVSPVSLEVTVRTTFDAGWAVRTTVNVSVVPVSATAVDPPVSVTVNPATSSSVVVAVTVWSATGSKSLSELASSTTIVIVELMFPSMILSSTPVTVTVCAVFQFNGVNVRGVFTVASPVSLEVMVRTTSDAGWAFKTTVNVSVVPVSATLVDPPVSATVNPATSSSVVVAVTVWLATGSKSLSELASSTTMVTVEVWFPSMILSSTPVTVTV